jgi:hypothetical protein
MSLFRIFKLDLSEDETNSLRVYENAIKAKRELNYKNGVFYVTTENMRKDLTVLKNQTETAEILPTMEE